MNTALMKLFEGDIYADDEPVMRGVSLACGPVDLPKGAECGDFDFDYSACGAFDFGCSLAPPPLCAEPLVVERGGARAAALLEVVADALLCGRDGVVERVDEETATVDFFCSGACEAMTIGVHAYAVAGGAAAKLSRFDGDALFFQTVLEEVRSAVAGFGVAPARVPRFPACALFAPPAAADVEETLLLAEDAPEMVPVAARMAQESKDAAIPVLAKHVALLCTWLAHESRAVCGSASVLVQQLCKQHPELTGDFLRSTAELLERASAEELSLRMLQRLKVELTRVR